MKQNATTLAVVVGIVAVAATGAGAAPTPLDLGTRLHDFSAGSGGQVLQIDANGDGFYDIGFNYFELVPGAELATVELIGLGRGLSDSLSATWPDLNATYPPVGPSGVLVEIPEGGSVVSAVDSYDPPIGGGIWAYDAEFLDPVLIGDPEVTPFSEAIVANRDFYMGFKYKESSSGPLHYGWVKCRFDWDAGGPLTDHWTIISAAVESLANTDIAAGDSGAVDCPADLDNGTGLGVSDGGVDINDLLFFLGAFEAGSAAADLDNNAGTGTPDGGVDINDLLFFLTHFEAGC